MRPGPRRDRWLLARREVLERCVFAMGQIAVGDPKSRSTFFSLGCMRPIVALAMGASLMVSGARQREPGQQVVLLPPELVQSLARHDFGLAEIQSFLFHSACVPSLPEQLSTRAARPPDAVAASALDIHPLQTGGVGVKMTHLPLWAGGTAPTTRLLRDLGV